MFKRISCLVLSFVLLWGILMQQVVAAEAVTESQQSTETVEIEEPAPAPAEEEQVIESNVMVDAIPVANADIVLVNGIAYVSLRATVLAFYPDAEVTWTQACTTVTADGLHLEIYPTESYIAANGRYLYLPLGVHYENGCMMLPARILAKIVGAEFSYSSVNGKIYFTSGSEPILSGDEYYNEDDLYWLSHIIYAESGNQPLDGKLAVGNVVLNRVADPAFPNSIRDVIYQKSQFTPVKNGTIHLTPNTESVIAAKLCLDGASVLPDALWFNRASSKSWAAKHRPYITTIGAHAFYA